RARLRRLLIAAGLVLTVVAAVAVSLVLDRRRDAALDQALTGGTCETDERSDPTGAPGSNHIPNPAYAVDPPSAGNHTPASARAGRYRGASLPPDGQLVHSLEHGYVILWHRPDLARPERDQLDDLQEQHPQDVLVVERASLPVPVAATAWQQRLLCQAVEPAVLERFVDARVGSGPEDVPRG
ncbi:MAG: hypothetical protein JWN57_1192, partial [Frankiales bacterium]|nr:hypothetical protein [Frankiales bacterium]